MRSVVQRVKQASVLVEHKITGEIGSGLLVLIAIEKGDSSLESVLISNRILSLRIFPDADGRMNHDVREIKGSLLVVPNFTLAARTQKGNRPNFSRALPSGEAEPLYQDLLRHLRQSGVTIASGVFGAHMEVHLINDGPVTFVLDTKD